MKRVYVAGPISNCPDYMIRFGDAKSRLLLNGYEVVNPAQMCLSLPVSFTHDQYMKICMAALECCDTIYLLNGWQNSVGAKIEAEYALFNNYTMIEEGSKDDITLNP